MAIPNVTEARLAEVLGAHLSPSQEIKDPDRLVGRERLLTQIRRALLSPGRHVFIYGERGVKGRPPWARTAGPLAALDNKNFVYLPCGERTTFFEVIGAVGNSVIDLEKRIGSQGRGLGIGINLPGGVGGVSLSRSPGVSEALPIPTTMTEAFDLLRYVRTKLQGQIIVGVDELDRVEGGDREEPLRGAAEERWIPG